MSRTSRVVLIVCIPQSIHAARWIHALRFSDWRVVVFPGVFGAPIPEMHPLVQVSTRGETLDLERGVIGFVPPSLIEKTGEDDRRRGFPFARAVTAMDVNQGPSPTSLIDVIDRIRPDLIHSMELQHNSYIVLAAREWSRSGFPPWLASSWGSDIFLYRRLREHRPVLGRLFRQVDALHSDCERDFEFAYRSGFNGYRFPPMAASGGADFSSYPDLASLELPSRRREILVKGYHNWAGRGLHILQAIHLIAPALKGYRIRITQGNRQSEKMAARLAALDDLDISVESYLPTHADVVKRLSHARIAIGLGISDGISTSMLEAMALGAFPIQSSTSCLGEWIQNGVTGLLVRWFDVNGMANAILKACQDDDMVDDAAASNRATVEARWNIRHLGETILAGYDDILRKSHDDER